MGQAKVRTRAILEAFPNCILCGGNEPATTVDHQPARALFDRKEWPEGYAFPACEICNQSSKHAENAMALLVRIKSENENNPQRRADMQKYVGAMRNNFARLVQPLSTREKRRFFKQEGLPAPPGGYANLHMAGMAAEDTQRTMDIVIRKILKALHFKRTGGIAPEDRCVAFQWFTNAHAHLLDDPEFASYRSLPVRPPMVRNRRDLSEQFGYRYGVTENRESSFYLMKFRFSLLAVGLVIQDPALLPSDAVADL